jgi:hypothetical protein
MHTTLQPLLDLLDEGLRLYRRHFLSYLVISATWFVPIAIAAGLSIALWDELGEELSLLLIICWVLLAGPLAVYLVHSVSRATAAAAASRQVVLGKALLVRPVRLLAMYLFAICFYMVSSIVSSALTMCVICPIYSAVIGMLGAIGAVGGETGVGGALQVALGALVVIAVVVLYGMALVINGATYASVVYGLQPFANDELPLGVCLQRSVDTLLHGFGRNLLAFLLASTIFGGVTVAITMAVGTLLPLPLLWLLGTDSPVAQSVSAVAWLLGLVVVLPPLPIWMTLLYQHNIAQREGWDLEARIQSLGDSARVA